MLMLTLGPKKDSAVSYRIIAFGGFMLRKYASKSPKLHSEYDMYFPAKFVQVPKFLVA